jgi:hypothetical protein
MEPTEQTKSRRDELLTQLVLVLCTFSTTSVLIDSLRLAMIGYAALALLLLSINTGVWPHTLLWRLLRRMVGHKYDTRYLWGELNLHRPRFDIGFRISERGHDDGNHDMLIVAFVVGSIYVFLPTRLCRHFKDMSLKSVSDDSDYGFYTIDCSIIWRWNRGYWSWHLPFFSFNHYSTEVLSTDGKRTVYLELAKDRSRDWKDRFAEKEAAQAANSEVHPYTYVRRNGEVQNRTATCYIDRMTWTRKWFPFFKHVKTSIWVTFNEEIGEEVGSWKGGTTGCGWELRRGETILQSLRRMEAERFFEKGRHHTRSEENKSTKRGFLARLFLP